MDRQIEHSKFHFSLSAVWFTKGPPPQKKSNGGHLQYKQAPTRFLHCPSSWGFTGELEPTPASLEREALRTGCDPVAGHIRITIHTDIHIQWRFTLHASMQVTCIFWSTKPLNGGANGANHTRNLQAFNFKIVVFIYFLSTNIFYFKSKINH